MLFLTHAQPRAHHIIAALASENILSHDLSFQRIVQSNEQAHDCLDQARNIRQFDHVVFVSPNAIDAFFQADLGSRAPQGHVSFTVGQVIVVGPGSLAALNFWLNKGSLRPVVGQVSEQVRTFDADGVLGQLRTLAALHAAQRPGVLIKVLVVKGAAGRTDWIEQARQGGLMVQELQAYTALDCDPGYASSSALIHCKQQDLLPSLVITSTANVARLVAWAQAQPVPNLLPWLQRQTTLAIHPRIAAQLTAMSFASVKEIPPGFEALRAAALKYGN